MKKEPNLVIELLRELRKREKKALKLLACAVLALILSNMIWALVCILGH